MQSTESSRMLEEARKLAQTGYGRRAAQRVVEFLTDLTESFNLLNMTRTPILIDAP